MLPRISWRDVSLWQKDNDANHPATLNLGAVVFCDDRHPGP